MKRFASDPKPIFTYLLAASVIAIGAGLYLGLTLGMAEISPTALFAAAGVLLWAAAWGEFMALCLRLRKGESAFTPETGYTLRAIGLCMVALAAVTLGCAALSASPIVLLLGVPAAVVFLAAVLLGVPVAAIFLGAALAAKILLGLLEHAMALEEEQEGVV